MSFSYLYIKVLFFDYINYSQKKQKIFCNFLRKPLYVKSSWLDFIINNSCCILIESNRSWLRVEINFFTEKIIKTEKNVCLILWIIYTALCIRIKNKATTYKSLNESNEIQLLAKIKQKLLILQFFSLKALKQSALFERHLQE